MDAVEDTNAPIYELYRVLDLKWWKYDNSRFEYVKKKKTKAIASWITDVVEDANAPITKKKTGQ